MYLKRIDLLGFKSFTDKTKIYLEPGVSCIVGPNGSGKSNISDALRWVFGEQSTRSLRGGKMEDVIFSGSKSRRQLGMAEVSIILDNSDGYLPLPNEEISVMRRIFRSGQSEYLINQQACRLKDIYSLFVDTGIGRDGISIIEQGKIEELISARPEERRAVVEDTAGIVKYRNRKREAVRKLDETQRHLERVGDIIGELSTRIEPLREQSEAAILYLSLSEEARNLELSLCLRTLIDAKNGLEQVTTQCSQTSEELMSKETLHMKEEAASEQLRLRINTMDEELASAQEEFYRLQLNRENIAAQLDVLKTKADNATQNRDRLAGELEELDKRQSARREEASVLEAQLIEQRAAAELMEKQIMDGQGDEQSRREAMAILEEKLRSSRDEAFEMANLLADLRNQYHYQEQLMEHNDQALLRLDEQEKQIGEFLEQKRLDEEAAKAAWEKGKKTQRENQEQHKKFEKEQKTLSDQLQEIASEETSCRYQVHALQSKLTMLQDMAQSYDGFFPGVRSILLAKKNNDPAAEGILGVMARLLDVPVAYRTAVEAYLGASLQNIVAESEKAAKEAILYLKRKDGGRATFMPLDTLHLRETADFSQVAVMKGVCGRASDLISCEKKVRPALEFLLANVLIVEDMDTASAAARATGYRRSIVTLDGDMINPGGTLSGGSHNKKSTELLGKQTLLEEVRAELAAKEKDLATWEEKLQALRSQAKSLDGKADELNSLISAQVNTIYALEKEIEQLAMAIETSNRQMESIELERGQLQENKGEILSRKEEIQEELKVKQEENDLLSAHVQEMQQTIDHKQTGLDKDREDTTKNRVELARQQQALAEMERSLERLRQEEENTTWEQEDKATDLALADKELAEYQSVLASEKQSLSQAEQFFARQEQVLNSKRHGLAAETAELQQFETTSKERLKAIEELRALMHQQELKKARLEADWENEEEKLREKFNVSFAEAAAMPPLEMEKREANKRLYQLRQSISQLGVVNIPSIEEYRQVSERHTFLVSQRNDLQEAKGSLEQVIGEMDVIMSSRFKKAFTSLNEEFHHAFVRLFNGGSAELILTEPENMLETGVDILVQPPGKRLSNYNLLSGGEKSLVGLALMFAVLAVRPTPFCVMDEVDAALDETNVERFSAYLQELSQKTQFLMISHRQGTMEAASALWGVTMEEEGVSKVISVRLEEKAKVS